MKTLERKPAAGLQRQKRLLSAVIIVVMLMLTPVCIAWAQGIAQISLTDIFISTLLDSGDTGSASALLSSTLATSSASASFRKAVDTELFETSTLSAFQIDEDAGLLGFESGEEVQDELEKLQGWLEEKGWSLTGANSQGVYTFAKSSGAFTWCYVSAVCVSAKTVVVIKVQ